MVVEWTSPDVGYVVDFPSDRPCFYHCLPVRYFSFLSGAEWVFAGGRGHDEIEDLRREIRDLKDEVAKLGRKE